jgi:hypothetical protein
MHLSSLARARWRGSSSSSFARGREYGRALRRSATSHAREAPKTRGMTSGCLGLLLRKRRRRKNPFARERKEQATRPLNLLLLSFLSRARGTSSQRSSLLLSYSNQPLPTWPPMTTIEGSMSHRLGRLLSPPATSPSVVAAACRRLTSVSTDCNDSDAMVLRFDLVSLFLPARGGGKRRRGARKKKERPVLLLLLIFFFEL